MGRTFPLFASLAATMLVATVLAVAATQDPVEAAFPGKNGRIAFTMFPWNEDAEIYKMRPDGSGLKPVTNNSADDVHPSWSPDGTRISFTRHEKIFVKYTSSGQIVRLTDNAGISSFDSAWSPDGARIAFDSNRDGDQEIYAMDSSDGSGVAKLTDNHNHDVDPVWSPDGVRIAFERDYDIWVMNADGTDQVNLTESPGSSEYQPNWSSDSTKIVFSKWGGELATTDIWVMNTDGSGLLNLTNTPASGEVYPVWSPNGRKMAFTEHDDIWVMNTDGTNRNNLTNTPDASEYVGDWQPLAAP